MPKLAATAECEQALGLRVDILNRTELVAKIPALSDRCVGGKYCPTDGIAEPSSVIQALAKAAFRMGALLYPGTEALDFQVEDSCVTSVLTDETEFLPSAVVNAAGAWAPLMAMRLGIVLPIWPVRAQLAETGPVGTLFKEFVTFPGEEIYCRPTLDGRLHIGPYAWVTPTDVENPSTLISTASYVGKISSLVPALKDVSIGRSWSGLVDATPDALPIIGPVPLVRNYFVAAGFSGHGFCLGPIVGQLLSELIVDGSASMSLDAFSLSRFLSDRKPAESALR
jgi:sarcosine oxidase subunit beta